MHRHTRGAPTYHCSAGPTHPQAQPADAAIEIQCVTCDMWDDASEKHKSIVTHQVPGK